MYYVLCERNDNSLVCKTFYKAVKENPISRPLLHSGKACQYTSRALHRKIIQAGMTQSMSRFACCIDNGTMEGFEGILKQKRYCGRRFAGNQELVRIIVHYIPYYNTRRVQQNFGVSAPMVKHKLGLNF